MKFLRYIFFIFPIYFISSSPLLAQKKADSLLSVARHFKSQNDLSNALRAYLQAIKEYERNHATAKMNNTYSEIGQVYANGNLFEKALEYFLKAGQGGQNSNNLENIAKMYVKIQDYNKALENYQKLLLDYEAEKNTDAIISTYRNMVTVFKYLGNYQQALIYNLKILDLATQQNDQTGIANALNNLGYNYKYLKNYDKAIGYFQQTITQRKKMGAKPIDLAPTLINLAITYQNIGDYENALSTILSALNIVKKEGDQKMIAQMEDIIAIIYLNKKDIYNAQVYNNESIDLSKELKNNQLLQNAYKTKSMILQEEEDYKQALEYYQKHLEMKDSLLIDKLLQQEALLREQFVVERTEKELQLLLVDEEMKDLAMKQLMLESDKKAKELELLRRDKDLEASAFKQKELEQQRALQELLIKEQQFEAEKKNRAITLLEKDKELQRIALKNKEAEEKEKQKTIELLTKDKEIQQLELQRQAEEELQARNFFISITSFFSIVVILVLIGLIMTRRANRKLALQKKEIENANEELVVKQEEIQAQRDAITVKNEQLNELYTDISEKNEQLNELYTDVTESISYASRIQSAILPLDEQINKALPDHFILFKPRDIVSGDFYWFAENEPQALYEERLDLDGKKTIFKGFSNHKLILAAVDCTGHGVPGAFMTMIANDLLTDIVIEKKITEPGKILSELHLGIRRILKQGETDNRDGMDIALISIDRQSQTVEFAGAKNPLIHIHQGILAHIKGDKMPIGGEQTEAERIFKTHTISMEPANSKTPGSDIQNNAHFFYLFSDGYQDQFGGPANKKFMISALKDLLLRIHQLPLAQQRNILSENIENWIKEGKEKQIDDILVIGVKL